MLLEISRVTNDAEHERALHRLEEVWGASNGEALDELNILTMLVDTYERERWPTMDGLDPIDIIKGAMEYGGHTRAHLVELLGSASRVSEILSRKRALTLDMIRTISEAWGIPQSLLIPSYSIRPTGVVIVQQPMSVSPEEADAMMMGRQAKGKIKRLKAARAFEERQSDITPVPALGKRGRKPVSN